MDSYHHLLPRLGQTRCYWALLSTDLQFIYLDPVLAYHLETEAPLLTGKSLLSFVHPDEQASAKTDLRSVLESRTLHGSVTRVRFSRLSKIRRQLGHTGPSQTWSEEEKLAVDANYMAVDIVINWAAEGLVLCFIHATVDLDPQSDNDELNKSDWTNWCGTPYMPLGQFQLLYRCLLDYLPQRSPNSPPTRIFQILANQPRRQLLLSWPPDQGNGLTGRDFAKLVENAELAAGPQKGNDAKTSCTRRYRATQLMSPSLGEVESIFIPHGSVIFACHKVESSMRSTSTDSTPMEHQLAYNNIDNPPNYPPSSAPAYYDSPTSYPLNPTYNQGYLPHQPVSIPRSPTYPSSRWSQVQQPQNYSPTQPLPPQQQWTTPSPTHPIAQLPPLLPHTHTSPSMNNNNHRPGPYSNTLAAGPSWQAPSGGYEVYRAPSPASYGIYSPNIPRSTGTGNVGAGLLPTNTSLTSPNVTHDVVPPPKRRISPGSVKGGDQYSHATSSGRGTGNRPSGILECSSCGATASPEWRKGPSGKKELCNACGLRYARSRAKKDGSGSGQGRTKKAEKVDIHEKAGPHHIVGGNGSTNGSDLKRGIRAKHGGSPGGRMTPPFSTIAAAGGSPGYANTIMRRSFGSGSEYGTPGTPPSASGSDSGQHGHVSYTPFATGATGEVGTQNGNTVTPSPSPPAPASISMPSTSASGSLGLSTSSASTSSALSAAGASTLTSTSTLPQIESAQDNNFIHYHPPSQQHDRVIPPLSVHPHSYSHSQLHSPQGSQSHPPHFPPVGSINSTGQAHYVHTYTARPSPLSQANNIVTGPAAGPLTPLSVPPSATEGADGTGLSNATQLPPLSYMDRLVGSNSSNGSNHTNHASSLGEAGIVKVEYADPQVQGNGGSGNAELGGGGTNTGREPLTPLSAESPIGPGIGGRHGRRLVLGGQ